MLFCKAFGRLHTPMAYQDELARFVGLSPGGLSVRAGSLPSLLACIVSRDGAQRSDPGYQPDVVTVVCPTAMITREV